MSASKHPKSPRPSDRDLKGDPGIGQSKGSGMAKTEPKEIAGENTFEGDVGNDPAERSAAIPAGKRGRTNK